MCATYLETAKLEEANRLLYLQSIPKLDIGVRLEKALPKALRLMTTNTYALEDLSKCKNPAIHSVLSFLVIQGYANGNYVVKDTDEREKIFKALNHLSNSNCFRMLQEYHSVIHKILKLNLFWTRDIEEWEWKSRNTYKQLKSLINHLFATYEVPEFMYQAWTETQEQVSYHHIEWFFHLTEGKNARDLFKLPIAFTKKMAHTFVNTPFPGYTILDAVRRAQIIGMGGDPRMADAILMSRLRHNFSNNVFWETVFQFFINTPMLNFDEVGTIMDYINEMKFVSQHRLVNGQRIYAPLIPGFSMKGRNIENLINETHAWHKELGKDKKTDMTTTWKESNIQPFEFEEGNKEKYVRKYEIFELLNAKELHAEGKSMHHCVFSYMNSCVKGNCSIFSLRVNNDRLSTIEIRDYKIVQVRGPYNKRPSDKEIMLIEKWAHREQLQLSNYAFGYR